MEEESKKEFKYLIMGRHGERADLAHYFDEDFQDDNDGDPLLTDKGIDQARQTGVMLKDTLESLDVKKVKIYSSPFLRTMQTAMCIADEMNVESVETHDGFVDFKTEIWMPTPLDQLKLRLKFNSLDYDYLEDYYYGEYYDKNGKLTSKGGMDCFKGIEHIKIFDPCKYTSEITKVGHGNISKGCERVERYYKNIINRMDIHKDIR